MKITFKKYCCIVLACVLLIAPFSVYTAPKTSAAIWGDFDNSSKLEMADLVLLAKYVSGWDVTLNSNVAPDVNQDGNINLSDLIVFARGFMGWGVHVLMWRDYLPFEEKLIEEFTKQTGIGVRTTVTTENEYGSKLVQMLTDRNVPDLICVDVERNFSVVGISALRALDNSIFNLGDNIWNTEYMNQFKIGDKNFGVAIRGSWHCENGNYVTYYNPSILRECGITQTPYDLYKSGNWNWEKQREIALAVYQNGAAKGYTSHSVKDFGVFMHSAGLDFVDYDIENYTFTNNIGLINDKLLTPWQEVMQQTKEFTLSYKYDFEEFQQGKVGMLTTTVEGLNKQYDWFDFENNETHQNLEVVPVAGPTQVTTYTPVNAKVWCVPKTAKNEAAAAEFARFFLDPDNTNMDSLFYNNQHKEVYDIITANNAKKRINTGKAIADYYSDGTYTKLCRELSNQYSPNFNTVLNKYKSDVNAGLSRANKQFASTASR